MGRTPNVIRLLQDPPLDGPTNMARDEALMTRVGSGDSPPTLRLYQWSTPTISLGYFQRFSDYQAVPPPAGELPVVRRLTGGGAILHDRELTYSLSLPAGHELIRGRPHRLYEIIQRCVIEAVAATGAMATGATPTACPVTDDSTPTRGPFFCFARRHRYDVILGADKLAGSAQRRTRQAVLQHGSIVVGNAFPQHPTAILNGDYDTLVTTLRQRLQARLSDATGYQLAPGAWTAPESNLARELTAKYAGDEWTRRR